MNRALVLALVLVSACAGPAARRDRVLLITTTTIQGSGLLDRLVEAYNASQDRYRVSATAVGSGAALAMARRGDADLLITHYPEGEAAFMADGLGQEQGAFMRNEFILAGPTSDPAGIRGDADLGQALDRIARTESRFVSRADDSGTHHQEMKLWSGIGRSPWTSPPKWYVQSGSGMAETLRVADELGAYVLTDVATFRHLRRTLGLESLAIGDPPVGNPYQYTLPKRPMNPEGARDLLRWLLGPGQDVVASYGTEENGEPLFHPARPR